MPVSHPLSLFYSFRPIRFLCVLAAILLFTQTKLSAQVYFDLPTESVKEKAENSGFEFAYTEGTPGDSTTLVFRKKIDQENFLVCFQNPFGICYQFGYRVPNKSVPMVIHKLNKQLVKRETEVWENREKTFLVTLVKLPAYTTVMYSPWKAAE